MISPKKLYAVLSRKEKMVLIGAFVAFIVSGAIFGSLYFFSKTEIVPAYGGTFTEGLVGQPVFINPVMPVNEIDRDISRLVFSSLADLAESITYSEEGRIWNVRLKEDITWHDSEPLTSDDVIFTIDTIQDPDSRSLLYASFQGVAAERLSEREIQFVLQNPYAFFAQDHLANLGIIPRHIFDGIPVQNYDIILDGRYPIGSGPYMITGYNVDGKNLTISDISLSAYDAYFGEQPYIETISFKFFKTKDELAEAYNNGTIDGFGISTAEGISESLKIRHQLHFFKSPRYYALFINQSTAPEALQELDVRKALSGAINRDTLVSSVFNDNATPLYGPTILNTDPVDTFDPSVLNGLKLSIVVPAESFLEKTADLIKTQWETYGANVTLDIVSLKEIQENVLKNNAYEIILFGNIVKESQDLFSFWHSSRRFYPDQNLALYQNQDVDDLLEAYRKSFNEEERKNYLKEASDIITQDIPALFLYSPDYVYVSSPKVGGFNTAQPINTSADRFADITSWYVRTKRIFTQRKPASDAANKKTKEEKALSDEYFEELERTLESTSDQDQPAESETDPTE
jgi:peptide/nickel transport system substrate-binding protein